MIAHHAHDPQARWGSSPRRDGSLHRGSARPGDESSPPPKKEQHALRLQLLQPTRAELAARWPWLRGVATAFIAIAAGLAGGAIGFVPIPLAALLGWSLIALGVSYCAGGFAMRGERTRWIPLAIGPAYAVSGAFVLTDPPIASLLLLLAISGAFVLGGIATMIGALVKRHAQLRRAMAAGGFAAALGLMVGSQWPVSGVSALCVAFAVIAAVQGAAYLRLALVGQRLARVRPLPVRATDEPLIGDRAEA
jgi:uncharacterized membrane protein HdeD (DUF308 family)